MRRCPATSDANRRPRAAVAGFDDISSAVDVVPALTTVAVPLHQVGQSAMELALSDEATGVVPISTSVVLRESTPRISR